MVEVTFAEFRRAMEAAAVSRTRIEKSDKERWSAYVKEHGVPEAACKVHARALAEPHKVVILDAGTSMDGYYIYSPSDEIAMRFVKD